MRHGRNYRKHYKRKRRDRAIRPGRMVRIVIDSSGRVDPEFTEYPSNAAPGSYAMYLGLYNADTMTKHYKSRCPDGQLTTAVRLSNGSIAFGTRCIWDIVHDSEQASARASWLRAAPRQP